MDNIITTHDDHDELISAIYLGTSHNVTFKRNPDGSATYRNGERFFAIGQEFEDDGETPWGWTWSTGVYDGGGDGEIEEYFSTDGGQDPAEPLKVAIRHLGAIEDTR